MAKPNPSPSNRSKVRIFFVDADLAPGDMHELTSALTTAIRPTHVLARVGATARLAPPAAEDDGNGAGDALVDVDESADIIGEPVDEAQAPKAAARPRTYKKPQPVELNMKAGDKPWAHFAQEKAPTSHRDKYLVAAVWLQEYAKVEAVTADHVFTCYKAAGWPFDVSDPAVTLRSLKGEGLLLPAGRGKFTVGHLGVAEVEKMKHGA